MTVKYCIRGHAKTPDNVYPNGACKTCAKERARKWREDHLNESNERVRKWKEENPDRFRENQRIRRLNNTEKDTENRRKWRANNKERKNETARKWYAANREKLLAQKRKWDEENKDKRVKSRIEWENKNKGRIQGIKKKYKLTRANRVPKWLTPEHMSEIESFYLKSKIMTEQTGVEHHVDHIVPLKGKNVSGLHVPWNLQVLTAAENMQKHNRWENRCV